VLEPQPLLVDVEAALEERLCLRVAPLALIEQGQIAERTADSNMVGPQRLLVDVEAALIEWLGFRVAPLPLIEFGQAVERDTD
jgi:hypothetical protein